MKLEEHDRYWEMQRPEQEALKDIYETRFFSIPERDEDQIEVQTSDAFGYIEGIIGQLYARNPACVVRKGMRALGDAEVAMTVANGFLSEECREAIEHGTRLALIHPMSFIKLVPRETEDPYKKVLPVAVCPWEVIVDVDAPTWEESRYVGHAYYEPLESAKAKFGANRKWLPRRRKPYFVRDRYNTEEQEAMPAAMATKYDKYVRVVEFYDLEEGRLYFWTPDIQGELRFLADEEIPVRSWDGSYMTTLVPLYFSSIPHRPMEGYSALRRIYDQLYEKNIVRSFQASAVRKVARQYLVRSGALDEENQGYMRSGVDGLFIEVDLEPDESLAEQIMPVPHTPLPAETSRYVAEVMDDQYTSTNQDPFSRGQGLGGRASAAEVAALVSYSSSQLGHLARKRDATIEELVRVYLATLATFVDDKTVPIDIKGAPVRPTTADLLGDFRVFAEDEGQTPVSEAMRKQQFLMNVPTLQALGADPKFLLEQAASMLGFEDIPLAPPPEPPPGAAGVLDSGAAPPDIQSAVATASPDDIAAMMGSV
jgi:hypothetical protein